MGGFGLGMLNTQCSVCLPKDHLGSTSLGHGQRSLLYPQSAAGIGRSRERCRNPMNFEIELDCGNSTPVTQAAQDTFSTQGLAAP